jgi:hypothetical protein
MLSRMLGRAPIGVAATALALFGIARYRRDLRRDHERLAKFEPSAIDTPFGRVEYAQAGDGPPVMVVHGVLGGFDFGVSVGRVNVPAGYRIISPSRFGFFGSPLPPDPSPGAQADAFAACWNTWTSGSCRWWRSRRGARRRCSSRCGTRSASHGWS